MKEVSRDFDRDIYVFSCFKWEAKKDLSFARINMFFVVNEHVNWKDCKKLSMCVTH